jgi:PKD repeat protein
LTVTGPGGQDTRTRTNYINVEPPSATKGDIDGDEDVDLDDYAVFQACLTGPGGDITAPPCDLADLDVDGDVDEADFGEFKACLNGAGLPSPPSCVN